MPRNTIDLWADYNSRVAAYYCFPEGGQSLPAFVWMYGGGQRTDRACGKYFTTQGYATVDINWGGKELSDSSDKNTDWGKILLSVSAGSRFVGKGEQTIIITREEFNHATA